jgi:hypothetical protein
MDRVRISPSCGIRTCAPGLADDLCSVSHMRPKLSKKDGIAAKDSTQLSGVDGKHLRMLACTLDLLVSFSAVQVQELWSN